jgi:alkylation response protein AidB-like acyl-CoA dehydrogenase
MFSLELSEEQRMILETARSFAKEQIRPRAHECDEHGHIPADLLRAGWELGLVSAVAPESCGGAGMERQAVTGAMVAEELAHGDLAVALALLTPALFAYPILTAGTDEQKQKYLACLAGTEPAAVTAAAMEPTMNFDLSALATKAEKKGAGWVLTGQKCLVPLASAAERFLVYAAKEGKPGYENLGAFIVEKDAPGLKVGERERWMGLAALETAGLTLAGVEVGPEALLGGEKGCDCGRLLSYSRVALAAMAIGVARAANEYARDYAKERVAFGEPIAHKQAIAFMIADDFMEIEAARLLTWEAAWRLDAGQEAFEAAYLAKLYTDQMAIKATDDAVQTLGGHGYIREHPVELFLRNARGFTTFEGIATV